VMDDNGNLQVIETTAYYITEAKMRLLSPQSYVREEGKGEIILSSNTTTFVF